MAIVTEKEWAEFRSSVLGPDSTTVGEVVRYMAECREGACRDEKRTLARTIASVLRSYSQTDLAVDVNLKGFVSVRGSGVRSFWEFTRRYGDLKGMKRDKWK